MCRNLAPEKRVVLDEIAGVLKSGGSLYVADLVVKRELTLEDPGQPRALGGNCFHDTTAEARVAKDLFIQSVNFHARKPADGKTGRQGFLF